MAPPLFEKLLPDITPFILVGGRATRFGGVDKHALPHPTRPGTFLDSITKALAFIGAPVLVARLGQENIWPGRRVIHDMVPDAGPLAGLQAALRAADTPWCLLLATDMPFLDSRVLSALCENRLTNCDAVVLCAPPGRSYGIRLSWIEARPSMVCQIAVSRSEETRVAASAASQGRRASTRQDGAPATAAADSTQADSVLQPMCALYHVRTRAMVDALLARGPTLDRWPSLHSLLAQLYVLHVATPRAFSLANVNSVSDWLRLRLSIGGSR